MAINKKHPKYADYIEKCKKLAENEDAEIERLKKEKGKLPYYFDDPSVSLHKKYAKKLKELQKEYYFLFEEDDK